MMLNKDLRSMYDCRLCEEDKSRKERYGCKSSSKQVVWETNYCFSCGGTDPECTNCNGYNKIQVYRCPKVLAAKVSYIIPFFTDWRVSNRVVWPNGKTRLYQPIRLTQAFDLLNEFVEEKIEDESKSSSSVRGNK